jgi:hypothetical protein
LHMQELSSTAPCFLGTLPQGYNCGYQCHEIQFWTQTVLHLQLVLQWENNVLWWMDYITIHINAFKFWYNSRTKELDIRWCREAYLQKVTNHRGSHNSSVSIVTMLQAGELGCNSWQG